MTAPLAADRWRRVIDLFNDAAEVPAAARGAWLEAACGGDDLLRREVESLLASDAPADAAASYAQIIESAIADAAGAVPDVDHVQRIGPYRLFEEIGAGGMGTVFLAERDDEFRQRVALKVARGVLSAEADRRFRAERQILASLEHPSIARLIDGGTTADGAPYIVMEYVDGSPIDEHARVRQLTTRERVALFCQVCDAVTYAHHNLVVHRDLKPSNILVTADGTPKLLDFGIAKLLDQSTAPDAPVTMTGARVLTPEYASPEQIRGEPITTSTDVYSLGVILFELLTGERPLAFDTHQAAEIERVVCHVEPRKPSLVVRPGREARQLAGDLDTIVLTALRKEPALRYQSPALLAEDLRRHIEGRPILARPATWRYRSSRFVQRHRVGVGGAAVIALLVVAFAAALVVQVRRVARERDTAQQVSGLLMEMYSAFNPSETRGVQVTAEAVLDRGAALIQAELKEQPDVQARMLDTIGSLYLEVGLTDRAIDVLQSSLSIGRSAGQRDTLEAAKTLNQLANAHRARQALAEAEPLARQALDIRRRLAGPRSPDTAESLDTLGVVFLLRGYTVEGAPLLTEALDIWRQTKGPDSAEFASTLLNLARFWRERADYLKAEDIPRGDLLKAEKFERERLAIRRKAFGDVHVFTTNSLSALGLLLRESGRPQEAEPLMREAVAIRRQLFGERHLSFIEAINNLALVLQDVGKRVEAEERYRLANDVIRKLSPNHPQLATNVGNMGTLLAEMGRFEDAAAAYHEAIGVRRRRLGGDHPGVARMQDNLARLLCDQERFAEALPIADEALAIRRAKLGDRHYETATSMVTRARVLAGLGRRAEAEPLLRNGNAIRAAALPPEDPRLRDDAQLLARLR